MDLTFQSLFYLFYRLAPFILVCFFVLGSLINSEAKGFMYLIGLLFTCVIAIGASNNSEVSSTTPACANLKIGGVASNTPISMVIFSYTFFYLVYPIGKYHLELNNVPTLIFFPILILGDIYWNYHFSCYHAINLFIAFIIGSGIGVFWAYIIDKSGMKSLQYYNVGSNRERCSMATKTKYRCDVYKNGVKVNF